MKRKKKDRKYKIDYKNCMRYQCEHCRYKQYCFKQEIKNERNNCNEQNIKNDRKYKL